MRRRTPWPPWLMKLLGRVPDSVVAQLADVDQPTVTRERNRLGIESFRARQAVVHWSPRMLGRLGKYSDADLAAELGLPKKVVKAKRVALGVPRLRRRKEDDAWTPERVALLGTDSDPKVAALLGVSSSVVAHQRRRRKIPGFFPPPLRVHWTPAMVGLLGKVADLEIGRRFGLSKDSVVWKRRALGIPAAPRRRADARSEEVAKLLLLPNPELRARGFTNHQLSLLRRKYGIPAPKVPSAAAPQMRAASRQWTPKVLRWLGTVPDSLLAERLGVTVSSVRAKRRSLGIPPFSRWAEVAPLLGMLPRLEVVVPRRKRRRRG